MLSIDALTAGYNGAAVLHDFSLAIAPGQVAAIIGPNGCGKSTLLRCIAGLLVPLKGAITLNGEAISQLEVRERARRIAFLPQTFEGGQDLTVEEMILLGRTPYLPPYGALTARDREIGEQAMQAARVGDFRTHRVGEISGGERQRVMVARALAQQPQVLLLDEPTSHLDIRYQHEILALARRLARREQLIVIVVLHQINLAAALADILVLLSGQGRVHAAGAVQEVMTGDNLESVYDVPLRIAPHPLTGRPQAQSVWVFEEEG